MSTILIVDDHVQYLSSVCQLLKLHLPQTQILTALDRSTAVQQVQAHACDLLILDYQLQVTTGTQLLRQLRARSAAVGRPLPPVVLTSSQPDVDLYARTAALRRLCPNPCSTNTSRASSSRC